MATLRRYHNCPVWGAHVDMVAWERSQVGKQRRRKGNKPDLAYDPGWDRGRTKLLLGEGTATLDWEDRESEGQDETRNEDVPSTQRHQENLSLFDVAEYRVAKRHGKERATFGDFEIIRVPKVVPISEEEPEFGDDWEQDEWEKVEVVSFKKTYSEVARSAIELEGKDPPR